MFALAVDVLVVFVFVVLVVDVVFVFGMLFVRSDWCLNSRTQRYLLTFKHQITSVIQ